MTGLYVRLRWGCNWPENALIFWQQLRIVHRLTDYPYWHAEQLCVITVAPKCVFHYHDHEVQAGLGRGVRHAHLQLVIVWADRRPQSV